LVGAGRCRWGDRQRLPRVRTAGVPLRIAVAGRTGRYNERRAGWVARLREFGDILGVVDDQFRPPSGRRQRACSSLPACVSFSIVFVLTPIASAACCFVSQVA
jgi:hypothetical protein